MSRCPTFTFQLSIMSKWLAKHIGTKVSFKFTIRKTCLYWHLLTLNIKPVFYLGIWNDDRNKIIVLPSFQLVTRINSENRNETEFINVLWHINLYKNIGISNWHNWSLDLTNMKFFTLFHFLTRFINSKYMNFYSTYLVGRNGAMWKT